MPTAQREFGFGTISEAWALLGVNAGPSARMATAGEWLIGLPKRPQALARPRRGSPHPRGSTRRSSV